MAKLGRPTGLIAYDTDINIKRRTAGKPAIVKWLRLRTVLYAAVIADGRRRHALHAGDARQRRHQRHPRPQSDVSCGCPMARCATPTPSASSTSSSSTREFIISVDGLPSTLVDFVGLPPRADGRQLVSVGPDQTHEVRVLVTDYSASPPAPSTSILFKLIDIDTGEVAEMRDHFFGP